MFGSQSWKLKPLLAVFTFVGKLEMFIFVFVPSIVGVIHFRAIFASILDIRMVSLHMLIELLYQRKYLVTGRAWYLLIFFVFPFDTILCHFQLAIVCFMCLFINLARSFVNKCLVIFNQILDFIWLSHFETVHKRILFFKTCFRFCLVGIKLFWITVLIFRT